MAWFSRRRSGLCRLGKADLRAIWEFCDRAPVDAVLARVPMELGVGRPSHAVGMFDGDRLRSLCWIGVNIVPLGWQRDDLPALAEHVRRHARIAQSLVGPEDQVLALWEELSASCPQPREVRSPQLSMVWQGSSACGYDDQVRPAQLRDVPMVAPASVAMFTEEIGYDPTQYGPGYLQRVHALVRDGHTFVRMAATDGTPYVLFKADIGALAGGVAQIQGVWIHPDWRGRGLAGPAIAAVAHQVSQSIAPTVSLYVNDYNLAAVRCYEKAGFDVVGHYATVLLS